MDRSVNVAGEHGMAGMASGFAMSGSGGSSFFCGMRDGVRGGQDGAYAGGNAYAWGGGGSGGLTRASATAVGGGYGGNGAVIITEFYR